MKRFSPVKPPRQCGTDFKGASRQFNPLREIAEQLRHIADKEWIVANNVI